MRRETQRVGDEVLAVEPADHVEIGPRHRLTVDFQIPHRRGHNRHTGVHGRLEQPAAKRQQLARAGGGPLRKTEHRGAGRERSRHLRDTTHPCPGALTVDEDRRAAGCQRPEQRPTPHVVARREDNGEQAAYGEHVGVPVVVRNDE